MNKLDEEEIIKLRKIKWKTGLSKKIDEFSEIISDDEVFKKYFGEKYVEKLVNKSKELWKNILKLSVIYTILMISLFSSQNISGTEFEIFGFGFKNIGKMKEFLLFFAAITTIASAILVAYQKYIDALIKECLKKIVPSYKYENIMLIHF